MASETAEKFTTCCNCEVDITEEPLYTCIKSDCSKIGEPYCHGCGQSAHKRKNHDFDIDADHIKLITLDILKQNIKRGSALVNKTLSVHYEKDRTNRRIMATSVAASTTLIGSQIVEFGLNSVAIATSAAVPVVGALFMASFEVVTHTQSYIKGEITKKEYGYRVAKGLTVSATMGLGCWGGVAIGGAVGTLIGGPIGALIGVIIGGIAGSVIGAKVGQKAFEALFPDDFIQSRQHERERMIKDSLKLFGFSSVKDVENPEIFNERELKKTYYTLAKRYHPDKNGGSAESYARFHEINAALGVLISLLQKADKTEVVKVLTQIRAIKWKRDIQALRKILKNEKLLYVVDVCCKWNGKLTMGFISTLTTADILEVINDLNNDETYNRTICVVDKNMFANVIEKWNNDNDLVMNNDIDEESKESKENAYDVLHENNLVNDMESKYDQNDDDDIEYDEMKELRDRLRQRKVLFVAEICKTCDEDCTLEYLLNLRENDILELIDEINKDDSNEHKISVMQKSKFAKIISQFAASQSELCVSK